MAKKRERDHTAWLTRQLRDAGAEVVVVQACAEVSGYPDRIVWHPRWHGWIEMKGVSTKLATRQRAVLQRLEERCPGRAVIVRSLVEDELFGVEAWDGSRIGAFETAAELLMLLEEHERRSRRVISLEDGDETWRTPRD